MRTIIPPRYVWISMLFLVMFCGPERPWAESEPASTMQNTASDSTFYKRGKESFPKHTLYPGAFVTGLAAGVTLPFAVGGSAALADKSAGSRYCGLAAGISTAVLWAWGGNKLMRLTAIEVPESYHPGLNERGRKDFDLGYTERAQQKRSAQYTLGFVIGVFTPVAILFYAFSSMDPIYD